MVINASRARTVPGPTVGLSTTAAPENALAIGSEEGVSQGAQDLIVAVFRLAVTDYLGLCYGYDEPRPWKMAKRTFHLDAETFLVSDWAEYLGDLVGIQATDVWHAARRVMLCDPRLVRHFDHFSLRT
jgi:hypothetical protein